MYGYLDVWNFSQFYRTSFPIRAAGKVRRKRKTAERKDLKEGRLDESKVGRKEGRKEGWRDGGKEGW